METDRMLEHEHDWHLVSIDYEGDSSVREFACAGCTEVWFAS